MKKARGGGREVMKSCPGNWHWMTPFTQNQKFCDRKVIEIFLFCSLPKTLSKVSLNECLNPLLRNFYFESGMFWIQKSDWNFPLLFITWQFHENSSNHPQKITSLFLIEIFFLGTSWPSYHIRSYLNAQRCTWPPENLNFQADTWCHR